MRGGGGGGGGSDVEEGCAQGGGNNAANSSASLAHKKKQAQTIWLLVFVVVIVGMTASITLVVWGSQSAHDEQDERFERQAVATVKAIENAWVSFEAANLWIHESCRSTADQASLLAGRIPSCTRQDFHELYLHMKEAFKVNFVAIGWATLILGTERQAVEEDSRAYYAKEYPDFNYSGFVGVEEENSNSVEDENIAPEKILTSLMGPRSQQSFYLPTHYIEPLEGNEWCVDFDMASVTRNEAVQDQDKAFRNWVPLVTERIILPTHNSVSEGYSVFYFHPGIPLPDHSAEPALDAACMAVYIPDVLRAAAVGQADETLTFLYDNEDYHYDEPAFLAGALMEPTAEMEPRLTFQKEVSLETVRSQYHCFVQEITIVARVWTAAVCKAPGTYQADKTYIWLGAALLLLATLGLAFWFLHTHRRAQHINKMQAEAAEEKAALLIESAEKAAKAERDLNEYISHGK
eukprot:scaffold795_cov187-Amphora_coffeaeformis.AAC.6